MALDVFQSFRQTFLAHKESVYIALGIALVSLALTYALQVNKVSEGEPPLFTGSLPVLGHAWGFMMNVNKVYESARDWSPNSHPVSLSIFGKRLYVVLNPKDVSASWRAKSLSFNSICVWGVQRMFGVSKEGCEKMSGEVDGRENLFETSHGFWRDAFAPGEALNDLTKKFLYFLETDLTNIEKNLHKTADGEQVVSLFLWCRDRMGMASTNAFLGPSILVNCPSLLDLLEDWEHEFYKLAIGLPKFMTGKAHPSLMKIISAFTKWGLDSEGMIKYLSIRTHIMKERNIDDWDIAACNFSTWSGTQANANPTMFWLLYNIIRNPKQRAIIEQEIAPAFSPSPSDPTVETLSDMKVLLEKTPMLHAMYWEALRYSGGSVSVREVTEDTYINGWKFKQGSTVMIPLRTNHQDPKVYGTEIDEFVPDRFLNDFERMSGDEGCPMTDVKPIVDNDKTGMAKQVTMKTMKPFGGGTTLCPGRHFATNEAVAFIATTLRRFDIQLVKGQKCATPTVHRPVMGVYPPDQDIQVKIRLRE